MNSGPNRISEHILLPSLLVQTNITPNATAIAFLEVLSPILNFSFYSYFKIIKSDYILYLKLPIAFSFFSGLSSKYINLAHSTLYVLSLPTSSNHSTPLAQNFPTTSVFFFPILLHPTFSLYLEHAKPFHTSFILVFTKFSFTFSVKLP